MSRRNTSGDIAIILVVAAAAISGFSCWPRQPGSEMVFDEITLNISAISHEGDDDQNQWQTICAVLNRHGEYDCLSVERTNCQQVGSIRVCDYNGISLTFSPPMTLKGLRQLHHDLLALKDNGVTLGLQHGALSADYLGLTAEGTISIKVRIAVTPDARLFVERRWEGICEEVPTDRNVFHDEITLRKGQEWVFYRTELATGREPVRRFFRLNIMSKQAQELSEEDFDRLIKRP